jgi:hypothetical protein
MKPNNSMKLPKPGVFDKIIFYFKNDWGHSNTNPK